MLLGAVGLEQFVTEAAPQIVPSFMEGVGSVVDDGLQFGQHSLLHCLLQVNQVRANRKSSFPYEMIRLVGVLHFDG